MVQVLDKHIAFDPKIANGQPHISGHRITVAQIAFWSDKSGLSADEIATTYHLTLGEVYAALSYYFDHKYQIDEQVRSNDLIVSQLKEKYVSKITHVRPN